MNKKLELAIAASQKGVKRAELVLQQAKENFAALNVDIQNGYIPNWSSAHGDLITAKERLDRAKEILSLLQYIGDDSK